MGGFGDTSQPAGLSGPEKDELRGLLGQDSGLNAADERRKQDLLNRSKGIRHDGG